MNIIRHRSPEELAQSLAVDIARDLAASANPYLVLPGGSSPLLLMKELKKHALDWNSIIVGTTDERCVPVVDPRSNIGQIQSIMGPLPKILTLWDDGIIASLPSFSATVTVLGMGADGHFASIFPEMEWDMETSEPYEVFAPKEPSRRVTLPINILLQSQRLVLLVCGPEKVQLIDEIQRELHGELPVAKLIAARPGIEIHTSL